MRIMLTNDDGIFATGMQTLALELQKSGYEVVIVAPDAERSGVSHAFTHLTPLRAKAVQLAGLEKIESYAVTGTPADCVKLGLGNLVQGVDCILSGINHGQNLGSDTLYSGTVSAAVEGCLEGIPSIAASLAGKGQMDFSAAASIVCQLLPEFMERKQRLWNINVPALPKDAIKGVRFTALAQQVYDGAYARRADTYGRAYYWPPAEAASVHVPPADCDIYWVNAGYVSITPININWTDRAALAQLQENDTRRG